MLAVSLMHSEFYAAEIGVVCREWIAALMVQMGQFDHAVGLLRLIEIAVA